jgi:biotin carboxyl carrier protein
MKMENNIQADRDCTVKAVLVQKGQSVLQGDALVDVE